MLYTKSTFFIFEHISTCSLRVQDWKIEKMANSQDATTKRSVHQHPHKLSKHKFIILKYIGPMYVHKSFFLYLKITIQPWCYRVKVIRSTSFTDVEFRKVERQYHTIWVDQCFLNILFPTCMF